MSDEMPRVRDPRARPLVPPPPPEVRRYGASPRERTGSGAMVFGIVVALGLATLTALAGGGAMLLGMMAVTDGDVNATLVGGALAAVLAVAAVAGYFIARSLPAGSRGPFWAMFVLCGASALVMLLGVCGAGAEFSR